MLTFHLSTTDTAQTYLLTAPLNKTLSTFVVVLGPSRKMLKQQVKRDKNRFLPHPFQSYHSKLTWYEAVWDTESVVKQQISDKQNWIINHENDEGCNLYNCDSLKSRTQNVRLHFLRSNSIRAVFDPGRKDILVFVFVFCLQLYSSPLAGSCTVLSLYDSVGMLRKWRDEPNYLQQTPLTRHRFRLTTDILNFGGMAQFCVVVLYNECFVLSITVGCKLSPASVRQIRCVKNYDNVTSQKYVLFF
jgi:hypothetical protein